MSQRQPEPRDAADKEAPPREQPDRLDDDGDFADEHTSPTVADEQDGGPEGIREPESPEGRGGDGGMD